MDQQQEKTINVPLSERQLRYLLKSIQYLDHKEAEYLERITAIHWGDLSYYLEKYRDKILPD